MHLKKLNKKFAKNGLTLHTNDCVFPVSTFLFCIHLHRKLVHPDNTQQKVSEMSLCFKSFIIFLLKYVLNRSVNVEN